MTNRKVPVDDANVTTTKISESEWVRSTTAHHRALALLETTPAAKARFEKVMAEIRARRATLRQLREAQSLTQSTVADLLEMDQSEISRLERRSDVLLSTLRSYVAATGGEMHIIVDYPDGGSVELLFGDD